VKVNPRGYFLALILSLFACGFLLSGPLLAQSTPPTPPAPTPDPVFANVFYGAVNPAFANFKTPVLVFVPGLGGVACDWYSTGTSGNAPCGSAPANDMYAYAYEKGYRTAFISPNADNTPATSSLQADASVLQTAIPRVANFYNVPQMYFIGHSKGGLDLQQAILDGGILPYVKALFTVASPNQGTALATWAFEPANQAIVQTIAKDFNFNLDIPAIADMTLANMSTFRTAADPIFDQLLNKPFFYFAGDGYFNSAVTIATGSLLRKLVPGTDQDSQNDGLVTVGETQLSPEYSNQLGVIGADHFQMNQGDKSFFKIRGRIEALETDSDVFQRVAVNGLSRFGGSAHNTWIWSAKWFNNKLYIGTGREELCLTLLTSDVRNGTSSYPSAMAGDQCPDEVTLAQSLAAEIWEYTPATNTWRMAYQSPSNIPISVNGTAVMTALDVGYRGMEVYTEADGTQALYVGTVTSGGAYQASPFQANGWPPPRILRTTDGQTWTPIRQTPGTFFGNIGNYFLNPSSLVRSFRSLTQFNGQLFVTAATYEGSGIIIASPNPSAGDNSFQQVSPNWSVMPTWDVEVFNNYLYATTGFTRAENSSETGYGVYKTAATGTPPYQFTPIVINGGYQNNASLLAPNGLYMHLYRNELYVSTNRPTELIKVRADDTWDLIVGEPRPLPAGVKVGTSGANGQITPLSGFGSGFGNWMNGHFWRMGSITGMGEPDQNASGQNLFLGTWDWSVGLQQFQSLVSLDSLFTHQYGTDVYRTEDGSHWSVITQAGFGDPNNSGTRSLEATPVGLFLGTARQRFGAEVLLRTSGSTNPLLAPRRLRAESGLTSGQTVSLAWDPPPNAVSFNVYRATVTSIAQMAAALGSINVPLPDGQSITVTVQEIESGEFNFLCTSNTSSSLEGLCNIILALSSNGFINSPASFPAPYDLVGQTTVATYTEQAPSTLPSLYYVRAVDVNGNLSDPSNIVEGPSKSAPITPLACDINGDGYVDSNDIALITESFGTPVFGSSDPRDANGDGQINVLDARFCATRCNQTGCLLQ
jgi:hypothetical protein